MGSFTDKQMQDLLSQGLSKKTVAERLNVTPQAIFHRIRKIRKQGATDSISPDNLPDIQPSGPRLSDQELSFIDLLYNSPETDHLSLIKLCGYTNIKESELSNIAADILERFILQTEDRRRIFRHLGAHEIAAARGLLDLARNDKSGSVKLQAWTLICKVLGILKDGNNEVNQPDMALTIFKTEITKRYETVNVFVSAPKPAPNHTANSQKRYEIEDNPLPAAIVDPESNPED